MHIDAWASRWCVSPVALQELRQLIGMDGLAAMPTLTVTGAMGSESRVQTVVRLEAASCGVWLTRNNCGALMDERGVPVRYGLANESKEQNRAVKSADLIGIRPVLVGPQHIGQVIGQFVSREVKREGWKYKGDKHEIAQLAWCNFVLSKGGDAAFCCGPGSFNGSTK